MAAILSSCSGRVMIERLLAQGVQSKITSASICLSLKLKHSKFICKATSPSQDLPPEIKDDPKFVPLNEEDPGYGPTALLLVGFGDGEILKIQELLKDMDANFVRIICCHKKMLKDTLWNCMHYDRQIANQAEQGLPRICFLSGMTGEEVMTIIQSFSNIGLENIAFAALVPNNANTVLETLIDEVMGDHERLNPK